MYVNKTHCFPLRKDIILDELILTLRETPLTDWHVYITMQSTKTLTLQIFRDC